MDGRPVKFIHNPAVEGTQLSQQGNDIVTVILPEPASPGFNGATAMKPWKSSPDLFKHNVSDKSFLSLVFGEVNGKSLTVTDFGGLDVGIPQAMRRSIDFAANSHGIGAG